MSRVWDQSRADGTRLLVLLAIADFADDNGVAWPSRVRLAEKTRVSVSTVKRVLWVLEQAGELKVEHVAGRSSRYTVTVGSVHSYDPGQNDPTPHGSVHSYDPTGRSIAVDPEPSFEPSIKTGNLDSAQSEIRKTISRFRAEHGFPTQDQAHA